MQQIIGIGGGSSAIIGDNIVLALPNILHVPITNPMYYGAKKFIKLKYNAQKAVEAPPLAPRTPTGIINSVLANSENIIIL